MRPRHRAAENVHQPWATLLALGSKRIETRSWRTRYRGDLLIHAARTRAEPALTDPPAAVQAAFGRPVRHGPDGYTRAMPAGALVGAARLVDCVRIGGLDWPAVEACLDERRYVHEVFQRLAPEARQGWTERDLGDYAPGRYAWLFEDPRIAVSPVPWRGRQGLFRAPAIPLALPRHVQAAA